jgi:putative membrane protein insertion efficiency factor
MKTINKLNIWLAYPLVLLIWFYQKTLSPDHGLPKGLFPSGYCKFYPTCSEYTISALKTYGLFPGIFLAVTRLLKCHPWHAPQVDPLPIKLN